MAAHHEPDPALHLESVTEVRKLSCPGCQLQQQTGGSHLVTSQGLDRPAVAGRPAEQATEVVRWIASFQGQFGVDEVTIGVPDESLIPHLQRQLARCGLQGGWGPGRPLGESGPLRLLDAVADYLPTRSYRATAALLRHPDVADWIQWGSGPGGPLEAEAAGDTETPFDPATMGSILDIYFDGFRWVMANTHSFRMRLDVDDEHVRFAEDLVPKPGSALAGFIEAQKGGLP